MCFPGKGTHITKNMCLPRRGIQITWNTCFLERGTYITDNKCDPGRGTNVTRDMCFIGRGTHITSHKCFPGGEHTSPGIWVSWEGKHTTLVVYVPPLRVVRSSHLKILKIPGGREGGSSETPWNRNSGD